MLAKPMAKPVSRSSFRYRAAVTYHTVKRHIRWFARRKELAGERCPDQMPYLCFHHETVLLRPLKDVDMQLQHNKIVNLRIAAGKLNGVILRPGQTLSYWRLVGKPTYKKGYLDGVTLTYGKVVPGCGGGLCQLSNLIYWMTLHTPLRVTERHRHGYDVFPDASRTQPFGSGATCFYPHGDLMIKNETEQDFQLSVRVGAEYLVGEWRTGTPLDRRYEIVERDHLFSGEYWGGFSRHNALFRRAYDLDDNFLGEEFITENHALMMYSPLIEAGPTVR